jgi:hypothetical protein
VRGSAGLCAVAAIAVVIAHLKHSKACAACGASSSSYAGSALARSASRSCAIRNGCTAPARRESKHSAKRVLGTHGRTKMKVWTEQFFEWRPIACKAGQKACIRAFAHR